MCRQAEQKNFKEKSSICLQERKKIDPPPPLLCNRDGHDRVFKSWLMGVVSFLFFFKQKDEQTHQSSCVLFPIKQKLRETQNRRKILFLSRKQYTQMREKVVSPIKGVKPDLFSLMPRLAKWMALLPNVKYNHPKTSHTRRHTTHLEIYFKKYIK